MRAVLYARVSTVDKGQDPEVQLDDLREYPDATAALRRPEADHGTGRLGRADAEAAAMTR